MISLLEKRLFHMEKAITNDEELRTALTDIIENTEPHDDADIEFISEAMELLLYIDGDDSEELCEAADAWSDNYLANRKRDLKPEAKKKRKTIRIKWLIPVAALLTLLLATMMVSYATGGDVWVLTKEAYSALTKKVEHFLDGNSSLIITTDYGYYNSLEEMAEKEDLNGALLPKDLPEEYAIDKIYFADLGDEKRIYIHISMEGNRSINIDIDLSHQANYAQERLTEVCGFMVCETHYDNIYQVEFDYGENFYRISANSREDLIAVVESMK